MQPSLLDLPLAPLPFGGITYEPQFDAERLVGQWNRVYSIMSDGKWRTLQELHYEIRARYQKLDSEAALSARLRDFRKPRFGSHTVERRRRGEPKAGLHEYRLAI